MADKKYYDILQTSPIFAMSLGSKELFHSNLWAWLINKDPEFLRVFFPDFKDKIDNCEVKREWENFDLAIWINNRDCKYLFIIENKTKSLPYESQLNEYSKKINDLKETKSFDKENIKKVLVSLSDADFFNSNLEFDGWRYMSYDNLHKNLSEAIKKSEKLKDDKENFNCLLVQEYIDCLDAINNLISEKIHQNSDFEFSDENNQLADLRIKDIYEKIKCEKIKNEIEKNLKNELPLTINGFELHFGTWYSHSQPLIDVYYQKGSEKNNLFKIGIQIQSGYSRMIHIPSNYKKDVTYNHFNNLGWFINDIRGKKKNFCQYSKSGEYLFIYQPIDMSDDNRKYENLRKRIEEDMKLASELIKSNAFNELKKG